MKRRLILWVPLIVFVVIVGFIVRGLYAPASRNIQSALIGQPVPEFSLARRRAGPAGPVAARPIARASRGWSTSSPAGAFPAGPKRRSSPSSPRRGVPIDGIAVRDRPEDVAAFLASYGNPFQAIGSDVDRRVQLDLGSAGRAGDLRDRRPGHHPPPAYRRDHAARTCRRSSRPGRRRDEERSCSLAPRCCSLATPVCSPISPACRRRNMPNKQLPDPRAGGAGAGADGDAALPRLPGAVDRGQRRRDGGRHARIWSAPGSRRREARADPRLADLALRQLGDL